MHAGEANFFASRKGIKTRLHVEENWGIRIRESGQMHETKLPVTFSHAAMSVTPECRIGDYRCIG